ncbi:MAG: hypothetical protein LBG59_06275 [Candidatus Peribacteria bacterium]|jgi:exodeoxyribonuclease-3|nr:hypothetical protein [Candidatus Peribacteria bacterium]
MDKLVEDNYIDVFRHFNPNVANTYTRRSYRSDARARNIGWRLDYFWVDNKVLPLIKNMIHQDTVEGSDHCPILLELK